MRRIFPAKAQRRKVNITFRKLPSRLCAFAGSCFLLVVLCISAHAQITETGGLAELKKGDYDNAFKLLSARLVSHPDDVAAQRGLLRVYLETGRYPEVEAVAKRILTKTTETAGESHDLGKHIEL